MVVVFGLDCRLRAFRYELIVLVFAFVWCGLGVYYWLDFCLVCGIWLICCLLFASGWFAVWFGVSIMGFRFGFDFVLWLDVRVCCTGCVFVFCGLLGLLPLGLERCLGVLRGGLLWIVGCVWFVVWFEFTFVVLVRVWVL